MNSGVLGGYTAQQLLNAIPLYAHQETVYSAIESPSFSGWVICSKEETDWNLTWNSLE